MSVYDDAFQYVLENEGVDSDHPNDRGGRTRYGVTEVVAREHGFDVRTLTLHQALDIYRADYFRQFSFLEDRRVAIKAMDIAVNVGVQRGIRILQRALGVKDDGVIGPETESAQRRFAADDLLERLCHAQGDFYVDIVRRNPDQIAFLKGWVRRAVRRPKVKIPS